MRTPFPLPPAPVASTPEEYLTRPQAAEYLKLSPSHLAKLAVTGGGPLMCRLGRAVRYRRRDLDAWASAGVCRSTSEAA